MLGWDFVLNSCVAVTVIHWECAPKASRSHSFWRPQWGGGFVIEKQNKVNEDKAQFYSNYFNRDLQNHPIQGGMNELTHSLLYSFENPTFRSKHIQIPQEVERNYRGCYCQSD